MSKTSKIGPIISSLNQSKESIEVKTPASKHQSSRNAFTYDQKSANNRGHIREQNDSSKELPKSKRSNSITSHSNKPKVVEFSSRLTAPTKSSEMKLRKSQIENELWVHTDQTEENEFSSDEDSESAVTPIVSAGIPFDTPIIGNIEGESTPHISATQELFSNETRNLKSGLQFGNRMATSTPAPSLPKEKIEEEKKEFELAQQTSTRTAPNPLDLVRKIKDATMRKSWNLSYDQQETILKTYCTRFYSESKPGLFWL